MNYETDFILLLVQMVLIAQHLVSTSNSLSHLYEHIIVKVHPAFDMFPFCWILTKLTFEALNIGI